MTIPGHEGEAVAPASRTATGVSEHMNATAVTTQVRRVGRGRAALMAVLLGSTVATVGAGAMSLAQFTDSRASTGSWSSGTIVLGVSPSTAFSATGILPGATGTQTIAVTNSGTGALRYALSSSSTNADVPTPKGLAAQIDLTIQVGTCASPGTTIFTGKLSTAGFGSNVQGQDTGDRAVAAGATENLCFSWSFPLASGNGFQNATTTTTFTFDAEQTLYN